MEIKLLDEIKKMKENLKERYIKLDIKGAIEEEIIDLEKSTGITLTKEMKNFLQIINGSNDKEVGVVTSDQTLPIRFLSIKEIKNYYNDYTETFEEVYGVDEELEELFDSRIKPYLVHNMWLPIAEFGGCTTVYFDADPTEFGTYGQIIVYQHDPDFIYYVGKNLTEFLYQSNHLFKEENIIIECFIDIIQQLFEEKYSQLIETNKIKNYSQDSLRQIVYDLRNNGIGFPSKEYLWNEIAVSRQYESFEVYWIDSSKNFLYNLKAEVVMESSKVISICLNNISRKKTISSVNKNGVPTVKTIDAPL